MSAKHTPGPWSVFNENYTLEVWGKGGSKDEVVHWGGFDPSDKPFSEQVANAHLIAAAPSMKSALEDASAFIARLLDADDEDRVSFVVNEGPELLGKIDAALSKTKDTP